MAAEPLPPAVWAYVGLGANLGAAEATVRQAAADLAALPEVVASRLSPLYRTRPVDATGPDFVNAVVALHTRYTPQQLWQAMQQIEQAYGRQRPYRNAPRTLDLDLLWFNDQTLETETLIVPHPRLHLRAFALQPLADLAPTLPLRGSTVSQLRQQLDNSGLQRL